MDSTTNAMPWWQSRIVVGAVISIICKALVLSGLAGDISNDMQTQLINAALLVLGGAGDLLAIYKRVKQEQAPALVASKAAAATANADPNEGGPWPLS